YQTSSGVPGSGNPEYILLNSGVPAGVSGFSNSNDNTLDVDYVRIYSFTTNNGPNIANPGWDTTGSWSLSGSAQYNPGATFGQTGTGDLHIYGGVGEADQTISGLSPNTTYTLTGFAQVGSGSNQGLLGVKNYSGGAGNTSGSVGNTSSAVWVQGAVS